jgi:serine protease
MELRREQDPAALTVAVERDLAALDARVAPLSALERRVLVLALPGRRFTGAAAAAFAAGHELTVRYGLVTAEPDLPTALFPEQPPRAAGPRTEGVDAFPPGCSVPPEPALSPAWAVERMQVPAAWAFAVAAGRPSQGEGVVVAQPDTGVTVHPELVGAFVGSGYDVLASDADPTDPLDGLNPGHGTATASLVVSPETLTVIGSAPRAVLMPIRAIESVVQVTQITVAQAIDWAVDHGAHVVTMSLGGLPAVALHRALARAVDADVIVLAAAGNCIRWVVWPARYDECVAVAGTNATDGQWPGSCRGPAVDIAAPAQNVFKAATGPAGADQGQGTSYAVALTAGVAALWLAHHGRPNLVGAARARGETLQGMFLRLLWETARRPPAWDTSTMGSGIADASALLAADLDVGRELSPAAAPVDPRERAARSVVSLVAEAVGPDAAVDPQLDWHRFGPEIAMALLGRPSHSDSRVHPEATAGPVSPQLAESVTNPRLRRRLGLADLPGAGGAR